MSDYDVELNIAQEVDLEVDGAVYHGADGATFIPSVSEEGVISWTNDGGYDNPTPRNIHGEDGVDGVTFTPSVSNEGVISWTNDGERQNPQSVNIKGPVGQDGTNGTDGVSPVVSSESITGGHRVTIVDVVGTTTFDVMDGTNGTDGTDGTNGATFTPSVSNAGVISWTNDAQLPNPQSVDMVTAVINALPSAVGVNF